MRGTKRPAELIERNNPSNQTQIDNQNRTDSVSRLLQVLVNHLPRKSDRICINIFCFPLFLVHELGSYHTNPQQYDQIMFDRLQKLTNHLTNSPFPINESASNYVRQQIKPLFDCLNDDLLKIYDQFRTFAGVSPPITNQEIPPIQLPGTEFAYFSQLPPELQLHIIDFLPNDGWESYCGVSRHFMKLYCMTRRQIDGQQMTASQFCQLLSNCSHLQKIKTPPHIPPTTQLIQSIPSKVHSIDLCGLRDIDLNSIKHLSTLNITHLALAECSRTIVGIFLGLLSTTPVKLELTNCMIDPIQFNHSIESGIFRSIQILNFSGLNLNNQQLNRLFDQNMPELICLNLAGNVCDQSIVQKICKNHKLLQLNLAFCLIDHTDVMQICKKLKSLEELDISHSRVNPSFSMIEMITHLVNLKRLTIKGWLVCFVHALFLLNHIPQLTYLDLSICPAIQKHDFITQWNSYCHSISPITPSCTQFNGRTVILSDELWFDTTNVLEQIVLDLLNYTKCIPVKSLFQLLFPPLSPITHRQQFLSIICKLLQITDLDGIQYLVCPTFYRKYLTNSSSL